MRLTKRKRTLVAIWSSALSCTGIEEWDATYPMILELETPNLFTSTHHVRKIRMASYYSAASSLPTSSSSELTPPDLPINEDLDDDGGGSLSLPSSHNKNNQDDDTTTGLGPVDEIIISRVTDDDENEDQDAQSPSLQLSPLVYRFYGKYRSRSPTSIPFVLLGPNVDHFKLIGQELAARGCSVIACERVRGAPSSRTVNAREQPNNEELRQPDDGAVLIRELLDALKWNRVVLVGCDSEALIMVKAAMELAPDRVVGLVLCGDLASVQDYCTSGKMSIEFPSGATRKLATKFAVDLCLKEYLKCPFTIVWAGDATVPPPRGQTVSSSELATLESLLDNRYVILGGGSAPHRRRPELFAWILTRFVEEKITATAPTIARSTARGGQQDKEPEPRPLNQLVRLREIFLSPGSFVVTGRMVATMIFYWSVMKVAIHQFDNVCAGLVNVQSAVKSIQLFRQTVLHWISKLTYKLGSLVFIIPSNHTASVDEKSSLSKGGPEDNNITAGLQEPSVDEKRPGKQTFSILLDDSQQEQNVTTSELSPDKAQEEQKKTENDEEGRVEKGKPIWKPLFFLDNVVA